MDWTLSDSELDAIKAEAVRRGRDEERSARGNPTLHRGLIDLACNEPRNTIEKRLVADAEQQADAISSLLFTAYSQGLRDGFAQAVHGPGSGNTPPVAPSQGEAGGGKGLVDKPSPIDLPRTCGLSCGKHGPCVLLDGHECPCEPTPPMFPAPKMDHGLKEGL